MVDAAYIFGHALWRLRRLIMRKPDIDPPNLLLDSIRHSIFFTGWKLRVVENPALNTVRKSRELPEGIAASPPAHASS